MEKPRFSPFISEKLAFAIAGLAQLIEEGLKEYQTATIYLGFGAEKQPEKMPAIVLSRLPGANWLMEIPVMPLRDWQPTLKLYQFNGWEDGPSVDFGTLAAGPKKLLEEPNQKHLCDAIISAIEDLILFSDYTSTPQLFVGDINGQLVDALNRKLYTLIKKFPTEINILPPRAFELESEADKSVDKKLKNRFQEYESEANAKGFAFYSTPGYLGVPRFLFLVDSSSENSKVYYWNGVDFVLCVAPEVVSAVTGKFEKGTVVAPMRTPAALVKKAWPKAIEHLDFDSTPEIDEL